jgi:DNA-directed RNA polymerase subunit K/omega
MSTQYFDNESDNGEVDEKNSDIDDDDESVTSSNVGELDGVAGMMDQEDEDDEVPEEEATEEVISNLLNPLNDNEEEEEEEEDDENYLQKFDKDIHKNYVFNFHPECAMHSQQEIEAMARVVRNLDDIVVDDLHKTLPFLTKFERARILGQRAKQINSGASPFVKIPDKFMDGYAIAELELAEKVIPFIIRRPLLNGSSEYWRIQDLENISF